MTRSRSKSRSNKTDQGSGPHMLPLERYCLLLLGMSWVLRWITPTEGVTEGRTLGCALLWFLTGTLWSWNRFKSGNLSRKPDLMDVGVALIVLGHLLSTAWLFYSGGQLRYAQNLCWEWLGLGVTYLVVREAIQVPSIRNSLLGITVCLGASCATLGIWQHYVWYEQASQQYQELKQEYLELTEKTGTALSPEEKTRLVSLREEFNRQGIPLEPNALKSWEDRLLSSREPLGFFALTNTFAAFLLLAMILFLACLSGLWKQHENYGSEENQGNVWAKWFLLAGTILVAYCLLLTKSRTAWIALVLGIGFLVVWGRAGNRFRFTPQRGMWFTGAGICLLMVAWWTGGVDKLILSEAPKSLQYRLSYWQTTGQILAEHPLTGTGPGNFRSFYQQHKPAESSEEIIDPHNFLLDLWVSAGLLGVIGLGFVFYGVWKNRRSLNTASNSQTEATKPQGEPPGFEPLVLLGGLGAFVVLVCYQFLSLSGELLPVLLTGGLLGGLLWFGRSWSVLSSWNSGTLSGRFCFSLAIVLGVHLFASGGMEMPAVVQMLILVLTVSIVPVASEQSQNKRVWQGLFPLAGLFCLGGIIYTAILPGLNSFALVSLGEQQMLRNQPAEEIVTNLQNAAELDPYSPLANQRLGDFGRSRCAGLQDWNGDWFQLAEKNYQAALRRDPRNSRRYWELATLYQQQFVATNSEQAAQSAEKFYQEAVSRYPQFAPLRAEYALSLFERGRIEEALKQAILAIELNEINQQQNHLNLLLEETQLERLEQIVSRSAKNSPGE